MQEHWKNYINGEWVEGGSGWLMVTAPGTGEDIAKIAMADTADINRAVAG